MDALSSLIKLVRPQASLELRCLLQGAFSIPHEQEQEASVPFHLVLNGACSVELPNARLLQLQPGDFVLFPKGGAHRICDIGSSDMPIQPVTTSDDGLLPLRRNGSGPADVDLLCGRFLCERGPAALLFKSLPDPLHISLSGTQSIASLQAVVTLMRNEADSKASGALAIVSALSQALLVMALRIYGERQSALPNILTLLSDTRLSHSVQVLLAEPGREWTIAALGEVAAMSRATYARHFQARAGMTVAEFLTYVRMATASELLLRTKRSAADIGMEVGYQSEAAFGKAFRHNTGLTPGRYRLQHQ
jgi:AraC family transcriptional activator of mtrCDE